MTVSNRIALGFAAITAVLILLGVYAVGQVGQVRDTVDKIVDRDISAMNQLARVEDGTRGMVEMRTTEVRRFLQASAGRGTMGASAVAGWRNQADATQAALTQLRETVSGFRDSAVSGERSELWTRMAVLLSRADAQLSQLRGDVELSFTAMGRGDVATFDAQEGAIGRERGALLDQLNQVRGTLTEAVSVGRQAVRDTYLTSRVSIIAALVAAVVLSMAVATWIRRSITRPLADFMGFVGRIGEGDLAGQTAAIGPDELGQLGGTLNTMVEGLRLLARQSREATENLNAAANEIRASTQEQAASVEEQLAAVQETAATVDEITHSGTQISRRAQEVIGAAQLTARSSDAGVAAIEDTVTAMDGIRDSAEAVAQNVVQLSEKTRAIGDIIGVVNDVSERSHLLALNASIEAAAAGEAGRSFAVVASEMKTLADQAKEATRDVRALLGEIQRGINSSVMLTEEAVKRVGAGRERTRTTQATIDEMGGRIQESIQTFQQIVASIGQQQIGIEQVTLALQNIRQASQQTAASTRQLDQAAGNLAGLSGQLLGLVERYRV